MDIKANKAWSSLVEGYEQLWNYAAHQLHNFLGLTQTQLLFASADPAFISYY